MAFEQDHSRVASAEARELCREHAVVRLEIGNTTIRDLRRVERGARAI